MNTRPVALQCFAHVAALAMLMLGAISLAGALSPFYIVGPRGPALPGAAIGLMMAGLAVMATVRAHRPLQCLAGAALCALSVYCLLVRGWPLAGGGGAAVSAGGSLQLALALLGLAVLVGSHRPWRRRLAVGLILSSLGLVAVSAAGLWVSPLEAWRLSEPPGAVTVELLVLLAGAALLVLFSAPPTPEHVLPRRLLAGGAAGVALCCLAWLALWSYAHRATDALGNTVLTRASEQIVEITRQQTALMRRLADRWNATGKPPSPAVWDAEAGSYLRDFSRLQLLAVLDASLDVQGLHYHQPPTSRWFASFAARDDVRQWLTSLQGGAAPQLSPFAEVGDERRLLAAPLRGTMEGWMVAAVFDMRGLLEQQMQAWAPAVRVYVSQNGVPAFGADPATTPHRALVLGSTDVLVQPGMTWRVTAWQEPHVRRAAGMPADALLFTTLAFVTILLMMQRLRMLSRHDAAQVAMQRDTLAHIVRTDDPHVLLRAICSMTEKREPHAACVIHALEPDGGRLALMAAPSLSPAACAVLEQLPLRADLTDRNAALAPAGAHDCELPPEAREVLQAEGFRSCVSHVIAPLDGPSLGMVSLFLRGAPTPEQRQIAESTAQFAAVAFERMRNRLQLRASEQRYRSLFAFNPDAIYSLDLAGRFSTANPAGQRLLECDEKKLVGRHFSEFLPPGDMERIEPLFRLTSEGEPQRYEVRGRDRTGQQTEVDVTTVPIAVDNAFVGMFAIVKNITERRRMERELHERNQFFLLSPEMFGLVDPEGCILQVNPAFCRITGYPSENLVGRPFHELLLPEDRGIARAATRRLARGEPIYDLDIRARHREGHMIWLRFRAARGDDNAVYLASREITDEIRVSQDLARKERSFRQLLDDNRDALVVVSPEGVVMYANPAARALLGKALTSHGAGLAALVSRRSAGGALFEWTLTGADDKPIDVEVLSAKTDWDGRTMHLLSLRDVRLRKASEKELRLLKRALQASHNAVIIADARDPSLPFTYVNPAFERITGYSVGEALGRNIDILYGPATEAAAIRGIRQSLKAKRDVHTVMRNYRKDGSTFWSDLYLAPVRDAHGKVTHYIGIHRDVSDEKEAEAQLSHTAHHDQLTGLPNRRLLERRLTEGCRCQTTIGVGMAVVFFDLDGFKPINDSMGHGVGDRILIEVAQRMRAHVRSQDIVARLSGDEFVMVLFDLPTEQAERITQRVITAISQPYELEEGWQHITASAGITFTCGPVDDPMRLVQQADLAMYKAKHEGRNNYQWHTADMSLHALERVRMRNDLQAALETSGLRLHYQPKFDRMTGRVVGIEALARWHHAERGEVPPAEFIPVAEETGQIVALGAWALETACAHNQWLRNQRLSSFAVAVNISPMQFQRRHFVRDLQAILGRTGLPATYLELEITEGVLLESADQTIATLHELKKLGVSVSIDDFGTGFSSLSYLKSLPIDSVKIDRSFVRDITDDSNDAAIARAIISMAHNLGLRVVAEGVETEEQLEFLRRNLCDEFQGFLLARPMPLENLVRFLERLGSLN